MQILSRIILCASSFHSFIHLGIHSFFFTDFLKGFCNFIDWMVSFEFQESLYLFKVFIHSFTYANTYLTIPSFFFFTDLLISLADWILFHYQFSTLMFSNWKPEGFAYTINQSLWLTIVFTIVLQSNGFWTLQNAYFKTYVTFLAYLKVKSSIM